MEARPIEVEIYATRNGKWPFVEWLHSLWDLRGQAILIKRIRRLELGNPGDCKHFDDILELRIDYGPEYRIYRGKKANTWIVLLGGGTKKTQNRDIEAAKASWADWQIRFRSQRAI